MVTLSLGKKKEEEQEERREGVQLSLAPRKTYTYTDTTGRSFSQQDIVKEDLRRREELDAYDRALQEEIKKRSQASDWRSNYLANKEADEEMRRDSAPEGDAYLRQRRAEAYENTSPARQYEMAREARRPEAESFYQSQRSGQMPSTLEDVRKSRADLANFLQQPQPQKPQPQETAAWRADRDSLIDRFSRGMEAVSDVSSRSNMPGYMATPEDQQILKNWQETLLEVERRGGIENLARMQESDAANDRRYGAALRGVNPDEMSFFEKAGNVIGGVFSGAGKQTLASAVGTYQGLQNANMMKAEEGISEGLRQVVNHYLGALANDPDGKDYGTQSLRASILKQAGVIGGEDYANRLMRYIDDKVASTRAAVPDAGFGDFYAGLDLDSVGRYSDTAWRNLNKIAGSEDVYKTMFALQDSAAADTQRAKDVLQSDFGDKLVDAGTSAVQSATDALISASMGLGGTGLMAMAPFAARAFGGSVAEASRAVMNRGEAIGKDMARRINRSAVTSSAIEVGTEMLWGSVGAISGVTGGGALDEAVTKRLSSALSRMAKTDTGASILSALGEKMLGGVFEGAEEMIADGLNWLLDTAGMYGEERGTLEELWAGAKDSFTTGMLSGWLGEVSKVATGPMQNAQLGRAIRGDVGELNNMAEAALASDGQLGRTFEDIAIKRGLDFDSGQSMAEQADRLSNRELGKIYRSYEDTLNNEGVSDIYRAVDRVKEGKELSERDVNRIVRNEEALQYLEDVTGEEINREDVTGNTIKALEGLASRQEESKAARAEYETQREKNLQDALWERQTTIQTQEALERMGVKGEAVDIITNAFIPGQNALEYAGDAMRFYNQGKNGKELDASTIGTLARNITPGQAMAAYNAGRMERIGEEYNGSEYEEESGSVRVRGGVQRDDGQSAGEPAGGVAGQTRSFEAREEIAGFRGGKKVAGVRSGPVSTKELGLRGGTSKKNIRIIQESKSKDFLEAKRIVEERGLKFVGFVGGALELEHISGRGNKLITQARGYYDPESGTVYVRMDHRVFTGAQLAKHEAMHDKIQKGEVDLAKARDLMRESLGTDKFTQALDAYAALYEGTDLSQDAVFEEMICDAAGNMNEFMYRGHNEDVLKNMSAMTAAREAGKKAVGDGQERESEGRYSEELPVGAAFTLEIDSEDAIKKNVQKGMKALDNLIRDAKTSANPEGLIEKNAMFRKEIGYVDFVWGKPGNGASFKKGYGFSHLIARRNVEGHNGEQIAQEIVNTIANATSGDVQRNDFAGGDEKRIRLYHDEYTVVLSKSGEENSWTLTGWKNKETGAYASGEGSDSSGATATTPIPTRRGGGDASVSALTVPNRQEEVKQNLEGKASREINPEREKLAKKTFGTTRDFREAGYIMRDGSLLDFSGKKQGGPSGVRYMDHREVAEVFSEGEISDEDTRYGSNTAYMNAFIDEGNIRLMDHQGVTVGEMEPTKEQYSLLKQYASRLLRNDDYFYLDISDAAGNTIESREYFQSDGADRIIRDLKAWYKNGELPYKSDLSQFRFSRDMDAAYDKAVRAGDMSTAQRMVNEAAKAAGYDMHLYHGARKGGGFTVFKGWQYFTESKAYAERYQQQDNPDSLYEVYAKSERMFDTRNEDAREIFDEMRQEYGLSAVQESGLPDWTDGYDISEFIEENDLDYDGIILDEGGDMVDGKPVSRGPSYVIRESNQIKSAAPVTYDDNGNVIPLSERFNPENPDIRFSQDLGSSDLYEANRQLKKDLSDALQKLKARTEQRDKWRRETTLTKGRQVRMDDAKRLARTMAKEHSSKVNTEEVAEKMKALAEYCLNAKEFDDAFYDEARTKSYEIAHMILNEAEILNEKGGEDFYKDFRDYLRNTKMFVPVTVQKDLTPDKWSDYRKSVFGTLNLSAADESATGIDSAYKELQEKFGEWLFPDDITNPADQIRQMLEVVETYRPVYEHINSYDMAEAVEWTANDILGRVVGEELRQTDPTYADKMDAKLKEQRQKGQEALQRVRQQRDDKVAKLKQHYQDVAANKRAKRIDSEQRTRLLKMIRRLNNKKLDRVSRALLDQYIGEIDTVAKSITKKTIRNLESLRDWYDEWTARQKAELGEDFVPDSYIEGLISRLNKKRINDLTQEEVADLITVLMNFETMLRTEHEFIDSQERRDTYAAALDMVSDYKHSKARQNKAFGQMLQSELLSPERYAHRLADYNDNNPLYKLTKELSDGQRRMFDYKRRADELFKEWVNDKKFTREIAGKDAKWIKVKGIVNGELKEIEITPAMRMSLYLHAKNEDNLRHVENGGVLIPNKELYQKGKMEDAYKDGIGVQAKFSRYMIHEISKDMSEKERAFADAAFNLYFNSMSKDAINEVSLEHVGYEIAKVLKYFPIDTSRDFLKADFGEVRPDGTVAAAGFLKERMKNASVPIMLYDMNSVLTKSIEGHSKYYGLAMPVRNLNKLLNVKFLDNSGSVRNNLLSSHTKYLDKIIRDVQTGVERSDDSFNKFISFIRHNYAGGVLALNAGVAVKQAASYPTAAAIIGYRPLIKALKDSNKKVDLDMIAKYTPLLWYRSLGYGTAELGDIAKRGGVAADMMSHKALNWIQAIDVATTTKLWTAAEYYVIDRMAAGELYEARLKSDMDAFHKEVAKVYNRIIEETQPNYAAMQRPGILRSTSDTVRALNMFKTQPFQNANILYDAFGNMRAKARQAKANPTEENLKALKDARKAAARAVTSQALSAFTFSLMQFLWDMVRGKTKKYKDDEDEMNFWSVNRALGLNILTSLGGMVPFGGTILEMAESWIDGLAVRFGGDPIFDQKFYGLSDNALEAVNDLAKTITGLSTDIIDVFQGKTTAETSARTIVDKVASLVLTTTGIPAENIVKDFRALAVNAGRVKGKIEGDAFLGAFVGDYLRAEFNALRVTTDPAKYPGDYYNLLYKAYKKDPAGYETIYNKMIDDSSGVFTDKKIKENLEKRMKKDQGVNNVKDLEQRWMSPNQQNQYDQYVDQLSAVKMEDNEKKKLLDKLYSLAIGDKTGEAMAGTIDEGKKVGINESDYIRFLSLYSSADENGSGDINNKELYGAVSRMGKITDDQKAFFWKNYAKGLKQETVDSVVGGGKQYGLTETEYMLYKMALTMSSNDSNYNQKETEAAIRSLSGLSDAERAYLFQTQHPTAKNNPWAYALQDGINGVTRGGGVTRGDSMEENTGAPAFPRWYTGRRKEKNIQGQAEDVSKRGEGLRNGMGISQQGFVAPNRWLYDNATPGAAFYKDIYEQGKKNSNLYDVMDSLATIAENRTAQLYGEKVKDNHSDASFSPATPAERLAIGIEAKMKVEKDPKKLKVLESLSSVLWDEIENGDALKDGAFWNQMLEYLGF